MSYKTAFFIISNTKKEESFYEYYEYYEYSKHPDYPKCKKCINPAIYGKNFTNLHCETHKDDDDINLVERECKSCHLITLLDKDDY